MTGMRLPWLLAAATLLVPGPAMAEDEMVDAEMCRVVDIDFTPSDDLQLVVWLEQADGTYVDTLFITDKTGRRGLGNRPGRMDFNSGWAWPYGRRTSTFPVWAHRHGMSWPMVIFQNDDGTHLNESALSHSPSQSSVEGFYCRPLRETEPAWDTQTCASVAFTDKGKVSETEDSLYPPRADVEYEPTVDHDSSAMFDELNPFDAVTQATPVGGVRFDLSWPIPDELPLGDYVLFVEASKEFDQNDTYNETTYPEPTGILYGDYGMPYRGQPSVVYQVAFEVGPDGSIGTTSSYAGYGDPDGLDGDVRAPDSTIDDDAPGSGASRLLTTVVGGDSFRLRVQSRLEFDDVSPGAPEGNGVLDATSSSATVSFYEPGDDGDLGVVTGYEVRYRAGTEMTADNFLDSSSAPGTLVPSGPGQPMEVTIDGLLPQTNYFVGIRAYDGCHNYGPITVIEASTTPRETGEVDACFIATAAYGSIMANDVQLLREFRDSTLRQTVLGELLVEAYYTFGPAAAGVIGESEELRGLARDVLDPLIDWLRDAWKADADDDDAEE